MAKQRIKWISLLLEIAVVMVGVTAAFAINNWAEIKQQREEEIFILRSFHEDLMKDYAVFSNRQIPVNQKRVRELGNFIKLLNANNFPEDSLRYYVNETLISTTNYRINRTTFESLKYSGNLDLISDLNLRKEIVSFYAVESGNSDRVTTKHIELRKQGIFPYLMKNADMGNVEPDFLSKREFKNLLFFYRLTYQLKVKEYQEVAEKSKELAERIEVELEELQ